MKYSIILPYYKKPMLHNTLVSFAHHYANRHDYEVIIVEDYKNADEDHKALLRIIREHKDSVLIRHLKVNVEFKNYYNSAPLINLGVKKAHGKFIVLTSPECFHKTNVLAGFNSALDKDPDAYIIAGVIDGREWTTAKEFRDFKYKTAGWYQHSKYHNRKLHFCSALSKTIYTKIGGFDEGYSYGFWRDDVDFVETVIRNDIRIITRDDIIAVHQQHSPLSPNIRDKLIKINQAYYVKKHERMQ